MSALDLIKMAAKKAPAPTKKDATPVIELAETDENKEAMKTLIEQKKVEKQAEATRKQSEAVLRPLAEQIREQHCKAEGKFHTAVKLKCGDEGPVTFKAPNMYSKIPMDQEDELKEALGPDYAKCFITQTDIAMTDKGLRMIEKILPKLMEMSAELTGGKEDEAWLELFEVEAHIRPTEYFHEQRMLDPKIGSAAKKLIDDGIVKPTTPSFTI